MYQTKKLLDAANYSDYIKTAHCPSSIAHSGSIIRL
jgi:hypothetical protein